MSERQQRAGHHFYAAIGMHDAAIALLNAGDLDGALRSADAALSLFDRLPFKAPERYSTHSIIGTIHLELGNRMEADDHFLRATQDGAEFADVAAEMAIQMVATGDRKGAGSMVIRAESLVRQGRTDAGATELTRDAKALSCLPMDPESAISLLDGTTGQWPIEFGQPLERANILATAYVLAGDTTRATEVAQQARSQARSSLARRLEVRLAITCAVASANGTDLYDAVSDAASVGHLALADTADLIGDHLDLLGQLPKELEESIERWPARWLPILRRQLERGDVPRGHVAARLLDRFGEMSDVGRLRAYSRTYRTRGRLIPLGFDLAHRVSPRLTVRDLGRVSMMLGDRTVSLTAMRRKPASLLMYLVTRPAFSANREQVLDELWPDTDPSSATNSLNQSLYFLRRELDPWYEEDVSVDYVAFQGDLVWLDQDLVKVESVAFLSAAQESLRRAASLDGIVELLGQYRGAFAPEFEYEEWAMAWRSRVHATFLELSSRSLKRAVREDNLEVARDIAVHCQDVDPTDVDNERRLIWLYWHLGSRAAAAAQHEHLASRERADGLEPLSLGALTSQPLPD